jgi:hypothetical protein
MKIQLCVLLWARPGRAGALTAYEDKVLALLGDHDGRLLQRARTRPGAGDGSPDETQLIAIARTDLYPVEVVPAG